MNYILKNENLEVTLSSKGGEMISVKGNDGTEYVWFGDEKYWGEHAPTLFPFVGRLTDGKYSLDDKIYPMTIHGFFKDTEMEVAEKTERSVTFKQSGPVKSEANEYDRKFETLLSYTLEKDTLKITFSVKNLDERTMYFGYGGHPGFNVPLKEGLDFTDYRLEFSENANPISIGLSKTCYIEGADVPYVLENDTTLPLKHDLFDHDAIVLRNMAREVTLKSDKDPHGVTVTYPGMPYLGIWHCPLTEAPYVCIEPWVTLPSRQDVVEKFEERHDMIALANGKTYRNNWQIRFF